MSIVWRATSPDAHSAGLQGAQRTAPAVLGECTETTSRAGRYGTAFYEPDSMEAQDIWARITLGEDVRRDLVMGTALEPEDREQQRLIAALRDSAADDIWDVTESDIAGESREDWDGYIALPPADNGAITGAWKPSKWASRLHVWSRLLATTGLFLYAAQQALLTAIDTVGHTSWT